MRTYVPTCHSYNNLWALISYSLPKSRPPPLTPTPVSGYKHSNAASDGGNATRICLSAHLCCETPTFQPPSQTALLPPCVRLITWRGRRPAPYSPSRCRRPLSPSAAHVAPGQPSSLREAGKQPEGPTPGNDYFLLLEFFYTIHRNATTIQLRVRSLGCRPAPFALSHHASDLNWADFPAFSLLIYGWLLKETEIQ